MIKKWFFGVGIIFLVAVVGFGADELIKLKLTLFQYKKPEGAGAVVSDYALKSKLLMNIDSEFPVSKQSEQIKSVFGIPELSLVSEESLWLWQKKKESQSRIEINGTSLQIGFARVSSSSASHQIRICIRDGKEPAKEPLFESEMVLPREQIAIVGFTGSNGTRYFLSFYNLEGALTGPEIEKLPKPLKKIRDVSPLFPQIALAARIQGQVEVEAVVNENGDVIDVTVVRGHPLLNQAAIEAVSQWKFEPYTKEEKPVKASFTVKVNFIIEEFVPGARKKKI